ncbi:MAG: hypothetical protein IJ769_08430 [Clostridia bacterium]|nr:hypothetical protein [Clostridia bacterium]
MTRKELQNLFPPVPDHFIARMERTLGGIESMNTRKPLKLRKTYRPILIAAILFALLTAVAAAVVLGNHALKDALNASGLEDAAGQVTDIHLSDAADGFALSLDEAVWEGKKLYLSCTVSVPEDGSAYLYSLMTPTLNGGHVESRPAVYFDQPWGPMVYPIGGDFPAEATVILSLEADSAMLADGPAALGLRADFYTTDRPLRQMPEGEAWAGEYLDSARSDYVYKTSDTLWYTRGAMPAIQLTSYREVADMDWQGEVDGWLSSGAEPEKVAAAGLIDHLAARTLAVPLDGEMLSDAALNDVDIHQFTWRDVTFTVERFHINHFSLELALHAEQADVEPPTTDGQFPERLHGALFELVNADGSPMMGMEGVTCTNCSVKQDPEGGYTVTITAEALFPAAPGPFTLLPQHWVSVENEEYERILASDTDDPIVTLTPAYSEAIRQEALKAQARLAAVRSWRAGDADQTVYATDSGSYYHFVPDCQGTRGAEAVSIAEALASGKPACPVCIGGPNSRAVVEEDFISN